LTDKVTILSLVNKIEANEFYNLYLLIINLLKFHYYIHINHHNTTSIFNLVSEFDAFSLSND
jgi:hypothetical protein